MRRRPEWFKKIVDYPPKLILKASVLDLTHIRILTSFEISEPGVSIILNIAMFVFKLTDLITENKSVNGIIL